MGQRSSCPTLQETQARKLQHLQKQPRGFESPVTNTALLEASFKSTQRLQWSSSTSCTWGWNLSVVVCVCSCVCVCELLCTWIISEWSLLHLCRWFTRHVRLSSFYMTFYVQINSLSPSSLVTPGVSCWSEVLVRTLGWRLTSYWHLDFLKNRLKIHKEQQQKKTPSFDI